MTEAFSALNLSGRVILVTGGGSGIGRAAARLMAARGAAVVVADRDAAEGVLTVAQIESAGGQSAFVRVDVSIEAEVKAMVDFAVTRFGGLHGAFNNAGIASRSTPLAQIASGDWDKLIAINLTGVFLCLKYELLHMERSGGGAIVNTSSGAGVLGIPGFADYAASKHGVVGLTRSAAADYGAHGIRINAVLPGTVDTPLLHQARPADAAEQQLKVGSKGHPIPRLAGASEIAEVAAFLLSDASSYMTGAAIAVDGGYTAI
ncbi:MAG: 3-oxoacyl-ACP reductase [Bradyrhizobium sp.]|nr:3-oxoacyl-ACP reductase [Bradyrhizobium sp.]